MQKLPLAVVVPFSRNERVFCDLQELFLGKFSNIKIYWYTCVLNIDVNHNVYLNNSSSLYFGRFLS